MTTWGQLGPDPHIALPAWAPPLCFTPLAPS
eukprot:CAMPEP_0113697642 /NCGR_PEP_ID=MMETSP0038_2-20120614/22249_1 /TAXON_ID=2898 /ORGANISM="Cryptomonas paramecium" /LENGTH=30 /DNA_ID=CAMNT_0000620679 /DNA_START=68 /DNA_END=156 /DNA_ORIENTATION=+ /assembly_acc=CAM_ASM_000170